VVDVDPDQTIAQLKDTSKIEKYTLSEEVFVF
jgi:hypothetical protein